MAIGESLRVPDGKLLCASGDHDWLHLRIWRRGTTRLLERQCRRCGKTRISETVGGIEGAEVGWE